MIYIPITTTMIKVVPYEKCGDKKHCKKELAVKNLVYGIERDINLQDMLA